MEPVDDYCTESANETRPGGGNMWEEVHEKLNSLLGPRTCARWFAAVTFKRASPGTVILEVPNEIFQVWIETNYMEELRTVLQETVGEVAEIQIEVVEPPLCLEEPTPPSNTCPPAATDKDHPLPASEFVERQKQASLNPSFTFQSFVVGVNSQFAHAACQAVAEKRGADFNPLFIHGGPGLGKTHLMQAAGTQWLEADPHHKVMYLTCERFINEFIEAVKKGDLERFRGRYRRAQLMLIDDVQFLAGKDRSQEEFFHTFNTLLDGHCQVILTSDRPASEIKNLEPRLMSRFECGLTVELQRPAFVTRLAILQKKMEEWDLQIDPEILRLLAERLKTNVRRLEGGLIRVGTYASLAGERVTLEKAEFLLRDLFREENNREVTIDLIQRTVAEHYDVRLADMTSRRRPSRIARPRQIAMYLSRTMTRCSLMEIGDAFGGRDHGTVIHAVRKVETLASEDDHFRAQIENLLAELKP